MAARLEGLREAGHGLYSIHTAEGFAGMALAHREICIELWLMCFLQVGMLQNGDLRLAGLVRVPRARDRKLISELAETSAFDAIIRNRRGC